MCLQKRLLVRSCLLAVLSLGWFILQANGQETTEAETPDRSAASPSKKTARTLGEVLQSMDRATVEEGFVVRLYSNDQVEKIQQTTAGHNRRHEEFSAKQRLLDKRAKNMNGKLPSNVTRIVSTSERFLQRFDRDGNGVLEGAEIEGQRGLNEADQDSDGRIEKQEMLRWYLSRMQGRGGFGGAGAAAELIGGRRGAIRQDAQPTVEEIEQVMSEQTAIQALQNKLNNDYADALQHRKVETFYRIVEASSEFLRLRTDTEERIIPYASIREFRRSLPR